MRAVEDAEVLQGSRMSFFRLEKHSDDGLTSTTGLLYAYGILRDFERGFPVEAMRCYLLVEARGS